MAENDIFAELGFSTGDVVPNPEGKGNAKAVRQTLASARRAEAISLRLAGFSNQQIAERMNVSTPEIDNLIEYQLSVVSNPQAQQMRELENSRLDRAQAAIWSKVLEGDLKAVNTFLRLSDRRSKMNGLDAPAKLNVSIGIRREMEQAFDELETLVLDAEIVEDENENQRQQLTGEDDSNAG